jgi:DNA-binding transcriptional LysR family regulator
MILIAVMNRIDTAVDLNLWVVLDALLTTNSATLAARRLGKTQSTVSHALERLRRVLGDPLLVRVGRGLAPTPRATALAGPLRAWLQAGVELARGSVPIEPAALRTTFTVIATDFVEAIVLPQLVATLRDQAPGVTLEVSTRADAAERAVRDGDIDLFVGPFVRELDGIIAQTLYEDELVVVMRRRHSLARGELTLARYVAGAHALATPRGLPGGLVDDRLAARRRARKVVVRTPSFATVARLAATTDLLGTLPASFARAAADAWPLVIRPLPLDLPRFAVQQVYRVTRRGDHALAWLRGQLHNACTPLRVAGTARDR